MVMLQNNYNTGSAHPVPVSNGRPNTAKFRFAAYAQSAPEPTVPDVACPGAETEASSTNCEITELVRAALGDDARSHALPLLAAAPAAALATITGAGLPAVNRIDFALIDGDPMTLISTLADHTTALMAQSTCALLLGEPRGSDDQRGTTRLTLEARAQFIPRPSHAYTNLRDKWLEARPKSQSYIDFGDFMLVRFTVTAAFLNGNGGQAYRLTPKDLGLALN